MSSEIPSKQEHNLSIEIFSLKIKMCYLFHFALQSWVISKNQESTVNCNFDTVLTKLLSDNTCQGLMIQYVGIEYNM